MKIWKKLWLSTMILALILNSAFTQITSFKKRINVNIVNYQDNCKFCFSKSSVNADKYSFSECPESYISNFRFSFYETEDKYTFTFFSNDNYQILFTNQSKYFLFPIFSDKRLLISVANNPDNICLTNNLSQNQIFPYEANFIDLFSSCDYSGQDSSQVFVLEKNDEIYFRKITFYAYLINNPYHTNSNNLISQSEIDIINDNYPEYRIFFDSEVKYKIVANTFDGYLHPKTNIYTFDWYSSSSSHRCVYYILLRESAQKEFSFFNISRCQLNDKYTFYIDKLNKTVFKFKNVTRNLYINSNRVENESFIYFNLINQTTNYPPDNKYYSYHDVSSFEHFLEFAKYSVSLTIADPLYYSFDGLEFVINNCDYREIDIPIREKGANITFKFLSSSSNTFIDSSVFPEGSKIIISNDDIPQKSFKYEYTIILPSQSDFSAFINVGKNKIEATSPSNETYGFIQQSFIVNDLTNITVNIILAPNFFYKFDGNYRNEITGTSTGCYNCENLFFSIGSRQYLYFRNIGPAGLDYTFYISGYQNWSGAVLENGRVNSLNNSFGNYNRDYFSISFTGLYFADYEGFYVFRVCADDYASVSFNRVMQLERLVYSYAPSCIDKTLYMTFGLFYELDILFSELTGGEYITFTMRIPGACDNCWTYTPQYYSKRQSLIYLPEVDLYSEKTLQLWVSLHMHFGTICTFRIYNNDRYIAFDIDHSELRYIVKNDSGTFTINTGFNLNSNTWYHITVYFLLDKITICIHIITCKDFFTPPTRTHYHDNIVGHQHYNTRHSLIMSIRNLIFYDYKISDQMRVANINMP